jgi:molybdopterin-guanine dinucleotide biosynthesis protein A
MGHDKATLEFAGKPLWERQLQLLRDLNPEEVWVSGRSRPEWLPPDTTFVPDSSPSRGPLSGIAAALALLKTSHLFVLAVDIVQMSSEELPKLCSLTKGGSGIVPQNPSGWLEPLCAIYPADAKQAAEAALSSDDTSLQSFAKTLLRDGLMTVYPIPESDLWLYANVNTPDELAAIRNTQARFPLST